MKRSKIIIDLVNDSINVVQAMDILYLLLQDNDDIKIQSWINNEINGYKDKDEIPDYRIIDCELIGNYISGSMYNGIQATNQPIPVKKEYDDILSKVRIMDGLKEIQQLSVAEKEEKSHALLMPVNPAIINNISLINGNVISASKRLSIYGYTNILNKLKSKLFNIFVELEKKYGNLDEYYIDFSNDESKKEINNVIINIIFDNSIQIGDGNKITDSNIGENNGN